MTGCVSYFAATLTLYVRFSTSFAFHEDSFQMNCYALLPGMILFMAHKKFLLTGNSLNLFFAYKYRWPALSMKYSLSSILLLYQFRFLWLSDIIASLNKYFFLGILNRRMGIKEQDYEVCKTVQCLINLIYIFSFNRDLHF